MGLLYDPLDEVLNSRAKVRVLRVLVTLGETVSGRQAARLARVPVKTALRALDDLVAMEVVRRQEASGQHLHQANREHVLWEGLRRLFDVEDERFTALLRHLRASLEALDQLKGKAAVISSVIFGSSARGDATPRSDLDLLVLVSDEDAADRARVLFSDLSPLLALRFGVHLSPVVLTAERFRERDAEGDPFTRAVTTDALPVFRSHPAELLNGRPRKS